MTRKIKFLLVEDNEDQIFLIKHSFSQSSDGKLEMDVVTDGEEAINYLKRRKEYQGKKRPDLIILDLKLPKKNGFEVLKEIKADTDLRSIPIIIFSSSDRHVDITKSYDYGASCYITKPISSDGFTKKIEEISNYWLNISILPCNEEMA